MSSYIYVLHSCNDHVTSLKVRPNGVKLVTRMLLEDVHRFTLLQNKILSDDKKHLQSKVIVLISGITRSQ
jgi:hypothetical protein